GTEEVKGRTRITAICEGLNRRETTNGKPYQSCYRQGAGGQDKAKDTQLQNARPNGFTGLNKGWCHMNHKQARSTLQYILHNQKTVSTSKIRGPVETVVHHNRMLEVDNRKLRKKIKRQKHVINRMEE